ncbi:helix-turn-helix domain-containing protein [Brevibacillus parabrevis]|uniref:helix-turn-helix domain-containing protein n=1 Tax=Brevibacillus parabrevis TaxID=54914 RepID=UPI0030B80A12
MDHNFLSEKQVSEIEDRYKSLQHLVMMDVDVLIKEVRAYQDILKDHDKAENVRFELPAVDEEMLKDYHDVLTPKDIQSILGIAHVTTYDLLNSGEFHVVRIGRSYRISKRVFLKWLKGQ